jgi:hypothetical protein
MELRTETGNSPVCWNLSQAPVKSVILTLIQEVEQTNGTKAKLIEAKIDELAA